MAEEEYLRSIPSSKNDPGLVYHWNDAATAAFVLVAAAPRVNATPAWLVVPGITVTRFKDNIMGFVALVAGGTFGHALIAPNNLVQFGNVTSRIRDIELGPFIQECMLQMPLNSVSVNIAIIRDRTVVNATPAARVIVAPNQLVFA